MIKDSIYEVFKNNCWEICAYCQELLAYRQLYFHTAFGGKDSADYFNQSPVVVHPHMIVYSISPVTNEQNFLSFEMFFRFFGPPILITFRRPCSLSQIGRQIKWA